MRKWRNGIGNTRRVALLGTAILLFLLGMAGTGLAQEAEKEFDYKQVDLRVGVWIDDLEEGEVLERGQAMGVGFQTNADAYAVVYRIDTEGEVTILWPRSRMDDGFVFGGHEYQLPVSGARRLSASSRSGEGFIQVIASPYPFDLRDLEVDFHHEFKAESFDFAVLGDPFLAMNEVNFAITRMEDTEDFVVTNFLSYYVHEKVDHPRYLCNQCHFDDDVTVHPYRDECTINITYDYGWSNRWYLDYGWYPVYHHPVYVYYDPWTWRPWVNFWYDPWYRCVDYPGWRWRNPAYVWCDSPFYNDHRYDGVRRKTGRGLYTGGGDRSRRTKTGEFRGVSRLVAERGPSESQREVMRTKQRGDERVRHGGTGPAVVRGGDAAQGGGRTSTVVRGEAPISRTRPQIESRQAENSLSRGGLQIRRPTPRRSDQGGSDRSTVGTTPVRRDSRSGANVRGSSGGERLRRPDSGSTTVRGRSSTTPGSGGEVDRNSRGQTDRKIKSVEPRRKPTRIWNSNRGSRSDRGVSPDRSGDSSRSRDRQVQPRSNRSDSGSKVNPSRQNSGSSRVQPSRKSSSGSRVKPTRKSGGSSSSGSSGSSSSVRGRSGSSNSSSSGRTSGGSRSGGSRSSSRTGGSSRGGR